MPRSAREGSRLPELIEPVSRCPETGQLCLASGTQLFRAELPNCGSRRFHAEVDFGGSLVKLRVVILSAGVTQFIVAYLVVLLPRTAGRTPLVMRVVIPSV